MGRVLAAILLANAACSTKEGEPLKTAAYAAPAPTGTIETATFAVG